MISLLGMERLQVYFISKIFSAVFFFPAFFIFQSLANFFSKMKTVYNHIYNIFFSYLENKEELTAERLNTPDLERCFQELMEVLEGKPDQSKEEYRPKVQDISPAANSPRYTPSTPECGDLEMVNMNDGTEYNVKREHGHSVKLNYEADDLPLPGETNINHSDFQILGGREVQRETIANGPPMRYNFNGQDTILTRDLWEALQQPNRPQSIEVKYEIDEDLQEKPLLTCQINLKNSSPEYVCTGPQRIGGQEGGLYLVSSLTTDRRQLGFIGSRSITLEGRPNASLELNNKTNSVVSYRTVQVFIYQINVLLVEDVKDKIRLKTIPTYRAKACGWSMMETELYLLSPSKSIIEITRKDREEEAVFLRLYSRRQLTELLAECNLSEGACCEFLSCCVVNLKDILYGSSFSSVVMSYPSGKTGKCKSVLLTPAIISEMVIRWQLKYGSYTVIGAKD